MRALRQGRYLARFAGNAGDVRRAQALRHEVFMADTGASRRDDGLDVDSFDPLCEHVLIEDVGSGDTLVAAFRMLPLASGQEIRKSYSAQYYGLERLADFEGPMVEMGRFCVAPGHSDPDILRVAWGAMAQYVDREGVEMLFGCSSFQGTDAKAYHDAFAVLSENHLAPTRWLPRPKAPKIVEFARKLAGRSDSANGVRTMPPLLRSYLTMGGWVSDHAVVDQDMNTLHVFTGLEVQAIPPRRRAALLAVANR